MPVPRLEVVTFMSALSNCLETFALSGLTSILCKLDLGYRVLKRIECSQSKLFSDME